MRANAADTGDGQFNQETIQAITWQAGTDGEFMPQNQTKDEGNDDQAFWAFTAMSAAELNFPAPGSDYQGYPTYAAMSQAVFNLQTARWDAATCNGGMRWQIQPLNAGYDYKNVAANGAYFQLAARLARYTGNTTYATYAEKMWNWLEASVLIDQGDGTTWKVYDGTGVDVQCSDANHAQYSYNYGLLIAGLAYMYDHVSAHPRFEETKQY